MGLSNPTFKLTPGEVERAEVIVKYSNEYHEIRDYDFRKWVVKVFLKYCLPQQLHSNTECVR
jgi:hypothetical protein